MNLWSLFLSVLSFNLLFFSNGKLPLPSLKNQHSSLETHNFYASGPVPISTKSGKRKKSNCNRIIKEGVKGKIILQKGNFMPSPEGKPKVGIGVKREIAFFEPTRDDQTEQGKGPGFYKKIYTKRVLRLFSDNQGCFVAKLKPGKYSMFVKEEGQWYANSFGPNNEIFEVEVKAGEVSELEFRINHGAAF
jgi:hypothetical protein